MTIADRVKKIIVDQLCVPAERVVDQASFIEDFRADSLDFIELVMHFEEEFGFEISDADCEKILTVRDAVSYIEKAVG